MLRTIQEVDKRKSLAEVAEAIASLCITSEHRKSSRVISAESFGPEVSG